MTNTPPNPLATIQRTDLFRAALASIDQHITVSGLQPGDRLPSDRDLALQLGVSRPVVRQAIKVLEGLGRVSVQHGVGTFVSNRFHSVAASELASGLTPGPELLSDLLPIRQAVEREVLVSAFANRNEGGAALLAEVVARQDLSVDKRLDIRLHLDFERTLGEICGNEVLRRLQALVHELWIESQLARHASDPADARFLDRHADILRCFESDDLEGALATMQLHLRELS